MPFEPPAQRSDPTANQRAKQEQIVAAARVVLVEHGVAGCTERRVAAAAGVSKNAVHYYFGDMAVLVDRAMAAHVAALVDELRAGLRSTRPGDALTTFTAAYLEAFGRHPHAALLWFEFFVHAVRSGRTADVGRIEDSMVDLVAEVLRSDGSSAVAADVYAVLVGSLLEQAVRGTTTEAAVRRVRLLAGPV